LSERCRYGRDSEIYYLDSKGERQLYECPHETEEEGFCIFHKEDYWNQNEETAQRVRNAFLDELRNNETEEDLLCIGYHLPPIGGIAREITELSRNVNFARGIFQLIDFNGVTF